LYAHDNNKKKSDAILSGSAKKGFSITSYGKFIGRETLDSIENGNLITVKNDVIKAVPVDTHKLSTHNEYIKVVNSKFFQDYINNNNLFNGRALWAFYEVVPFTQISQIKSKLKLAQVIATDRKDQTCLDFIEKALNYL
jgi:hypothetical protein